MREEGQVSSAVPLSSSFTVGGVVWGMAAHLPSLSLPSPGFLINNYAATYHIQLQLAQFTPRVDSCVSRITCIPFSASRKSADDAFPKYSNAQDAGVLSGEKNLGILTTPLKRSINTE